MQWLLLILVLPYTFLLLVIFKGLMKIQPYSPESVPDVFVSVITACRNEERNLPSFLSDIAEQSYDPVLYELVVVDDHSADSTTGIASSFAGIRNLKAITNPGMGKKMAVRTGIEASSGGFIVTTDADCRIGKEWISTIASYQQEHSPRMIICPVMLEESAGFFGCFQDLEFLSLQGITAGTAANGNPVMCNGANLAFTKEIYNLHKNDLHYELASGDDVFLLHSIKKTGRKHIKWLESAFAAVKTRPADNIKSFLDQRARWISKAGAYSDGYTRILAIVTFVTIAIQAFLLIAGIFHTGFLSVFGAFVAVKSVPDCLILGNTAGRYGKNKLMRWFIPSQIAYPFYVLAVIFWWFLHRAKWSD